MKVKDTYLVERYGKSQQLFELEDGTYKITDSGQYRLSHMTIENVNYKEAKKLINQKIKNEQKSGKENSRNG